MMERRDLTDHLSQRMLEQLTQEAFGAPVKRKGGFSRGLALAACVALVVMAVNFDTVYAAVQRLMYFLPGSGAVAEEEMAGDYWLPEAEFTACTRQGNYVVSYLYRRGDTLALGVKKEVTGLPTEEDSVPLPGEPDATPSKAPQGMAGEPAPEARQTGPLDLVVDIRDGEGNLLELEKAQNNVFSTHDMTTGKGSSEVYLEFEGFTLERFTLVLDKEVEFPVELRRVDLESYILDPDFSSRSHGYTISMVPLNQNGTRFALMPAPEDQTGDIPETSYWSPLTYDIKAVGKDGKVYQPETVNSRPGCQEFYIPELPDTQITTVTVTGILESTRYDKPKASVRLPAMKLGEEVELDQEISLWNHTLKVEAAGLTREGTLWVRVQQEGQNGDRWLNQVDLEWPETANQHHTGERSMEDNSYIIGTTGMESQAGKRIDLPVTFVSVVQKGWWEFRVE